MAHGCLWVVSRGTSHQANIGLSSSTEWYTSLVLFFHEKRSATHAFSLRDIAKFSFSNCVLYIQLDERLELLGLLEDVVNIFRKQICSYDSFLKVMMVPSQFVMKDRF